MSDNAHTIESPWLTKRQAAEYLALSTRSIDYARQRGAIPFHRVGRKVIMHRDDLDRYMRRFRVDVDALTDGGAA